ncbi:ABC transporter permease, partial [Streptomyces sp. RB6PN23]|nr:ABC transporter permease [Streptomyces silvisoli]
MRKPIRRLAVAAATGMLTAGAFATAGGLSTASAAPQHPTHVATVSVRGGGGGWGGGCCGGWGGGWGGG